MKKRFTLVLIAIIICTISALYDRAPSNVEHVGSNVPSDTTGNVPGNVEQVSSDAPSNVPSNFEYVGSNEMWYFYVDKTSIKTTKDGLGIYVKERQYPTAKGRAEMDSSIPSSMVNNMAKMLTSPGFYVSTEAIYNINDNIAREYNVIGHSMVKSVRDKKEIRNIDSISDPQLIREGRELSAKHQSMVRKFLSDNSHIYNINVTAKTNTNPSATTAKSQTGTVTGNDVILRSMPSIGGAEIDYLQKGAIVKIIGKESCVDKNTAVLTSPKIVTYNSQRIQLEKGQIVDIVSVNGNMYNVKVKIDNRWLSGLTLGSNELRKIYGDVWYNVTTVNGKTGWIFGELLSVTQ